MVVLVVNLLHDFGHALHGHALRHLADNSFVREDFVELVCVDLAACVIVCNTENVPKSAILVLYTPSSAQHASMRQTMQERDRKRQKDQT